MGQEQAIHQLTGVLAEGWGISDRGILRVGMAADMNLISMSKLHNEQQQYVDDMPGGARRYTREARGFDGVWVNGCKVLEDDAYTPLHAGCGRVI